MLLGASLSSNLCFGLIFAREKYSVCITIVTSIKEKDQ